MHAEKLDILIGTPHQSHLILRPLAKSTQNLDHEKCCRVEVIVSVGNFKGSSQVIIEENSFRQLQQALHHFSTIPVGEFTFTSLGREFWASIRGDNSGKFEAYCVLDDHENKYTRLRFKVEFGKAELQQSLASLKKSLTALEITPANK